MTLHPYMGRGCDQAQRPEGNDKPYMSPYPYPCEGRRPNGRESGIQRGEGWSRGYSCSSGPISAGPSRPARRGRGGAHALTWACIGFLQQNPCAGLSGFYNTGRFVGPDQRRRKRPRPPGPRARGWCTPVHQGARPRRPRRGLRRRAPRAQRRAPTEIRPGPNMSGLRGGGAFAAELREERQQPRFTVALYLRGGLADT
jgi:hypothetical protein